MTVRFDTSEFFRSHCRQPKGRGCWAFCFDNSNEPRFAPGSMSFAEAKVWAKAVAKLHGHTVARVMP
jgi:hypothetical protein